MTFTVDDDTHIALDPIGESPPSRTTTEVVRRPGGHRRWMAPLILPAALTVVVVSAGVPDRSPDQSGVAASNPAHPDDAPYHVQSAAVEPPLPGDQPIGPFDPSTSIANYDASVVATVVDGALVSTQPGGSVDNHWTDLPPGFELRALSTAGSQAALVRHRFGDGGRVLSSDILIAERSMVDPAIPAKVTIHHLEGLIEPEAFATDGASLFVIDHQAGSEPGTYRIRPLNLVTGELEEMLGPSKQPLIEDMNGTGRRQIWGLNDHRLYTLYIRQTDHLHASGRSGTDGFVHILDLDEEWAFCLDLPPTFGKGDLATTALAVGSTTVAVLDLSAGDGGQLAYASTVDRTVTEVIDLPPSFRRTMKAMLVADAEQPGRPADWQPTVHLAMYGTALAVGVGEAVVWFDGTTLEPLVGGPEPDSDRAFEERIELNGPLVGLTTLPGNGVLAWTVAGQGPEQLSPPRTRP